MLPKIEGGSPAKKQPKKTPGAGNRGGRGASGRTASRTDASRRARDARRVDPPKKKPKKSKDTGSKKKKVTKPKKDKAIRNIKKNRSKKTNPPKPKKAGIVKTTPTPKTYNVTDLTSFNDQSREILNAYIAMAGSELFQYLNSQTIDGAYSDVAIINVLSRRRQAYTPNRMIELAQSFIKRMWIDSGVLYVDIEDASRWDECVLSLNILQDLTPIAETVN